MIGLSIIDRYVFREVAASVLACFAIFCLSGLIAGFLPIFQKGMETNLQLTLILFQVLINALPGTLVTVLPLSLTVGILLALGRLSADNEIAAIKSSGISPARLLPPVLTLGILAFLISLWCTLVLIPQGIAKGRQLMHQALTTRADAGLEEKTFFDNFKDLIIYVDHIDRSTGVMTNLFIRQQLHTGKDDAKPHESEDSVQIILARHGRVLPDPEGRALVLGLREGTILRENEVGDFVRGLSFETSTFKYPLGDLADQYSQRSFEEMGIREIMVRVREAEVKLTTAEKQAARDYYRRASTLGRVFITQRFAHPLACIALCLMAFPLGVLGLGRNRLNNVTLGIAVIFIYYAMALSVERMARSGLALPELVLLAPPVVFSAMGLYFLRCVRLERAPWPVAKGRALIQRIRS